MPCNILHTHQTLSHQGTHSRPISEGDQAALVASSFSMNAAPLVLSSPAARNPKSNASMYCPQTWDRLKTQLHDLYIQQQRPLGSVKEIMLWRYRFRPSDRMYKQKFKEWGWAKNGRFSRSATNNYKAPQRGRSGHNYVSHRADIPAWIHFSSTPEQYDKMNLAIHCYIDGHFCASSKRWERRTFDIASSDGTTSRLGAWHGMHEKCNNASILIRWNAPGHAFSQLRKMCEDAATIISHDDPAALVYLWPICVDLAGFRHMMPTLEMDILRLALNYLKCRVGELYGGRHPVFLLLESLCAIPHIEIEEALQVGYETSIRAFETVK
ncbi:hypothetical protein CC80DRAFT_536664 [Byssothecium circinans]|uniref:Clr5 domain-containing protein n=1 Tax=Byssothecium circinans TaxID=147558 RepID=A0A6A5TR81_9PLEO|nr:hypothetical protein CC80DRAFT_536664 [Byssothecium circinans]